MCRRKPTARAVWRLFRAAPGIFQAIGWATLAIILALILLPGPARAADREARVGNDFVRVSEQPCTNARVLADIQAAGEKAEDYRAASAQFRGEAFAGCWTPDLKDGVVWLRYEDGDTGMVPMRSLKPVPEA